MAEKTTVLIRTLPLALALLVLLPQAAAADTSTRIIVQREPGLSAAERADIRDDADVRLVRNLSLPNTEVVSAGRGAVDRALRELRADRDVAYAEIDHRRRGFAPDPFMPHLWGLENTGQAFLPYYSAGVNDADSDVVAGWGRLTNPGDEQIVAVVDTGIDAAHEDLAGSVGLQRNFVGTNGPGAPDGDGHGTHVSGTVAARRENGDGIAGVAPNATIMALRALDDEGSGFDSDIAEAFDYAGDYASGNNEVRVVNASLGGSGGGETLRTVIAAHSDTLFVVAAGNGGTDGVGDNNDAAPQYPCNVPEPNVLCVGASTNQDQRGTFSNYGAFTVDLFAPGKAIVSTWKGDTYNDTGGTSMAAPQVSAIAALVLSAAPSLPTAALKEILLASVDAKSAFAGRSVSGGRLNVERAVRWAQDDQPLADDDGDGIANAADACRMTAASGSADGCPDADEDAIPNHLDNCPTIANPGQANGDGRADGGDACDNDFDNDGRANGADSCPTVFALTADGCPAPPNGDGDAFADAADACPAEGANTRNGCPLPALTGLSQKVAKRGSRRSVTVRASTTRAAVVRILVQRKKGRKWVKVKKRTLATRGNRIALKVSRLRRGRHRTVVAVYSNAGSGTSATRYFRVR